MFVWFEPDYWRILIKLCAYLPQLTKECSKEEINTIEEGLS